MAGVNDNLIPPKAGIYQIKFIGCDWFYVGSAVNLNKRYNNHLSDLRKNKHANKIMQNVFNKYGADSLRFVAKEYIENLEQLVGREQYYINKLEPNLNINQTAGSWLNRKHTVSTKKKMSEAAKKRKHHNTENLISAPLKKKLRCVNNGTITVFSSIYELEKSLGMKGTNGSLRRKLLSKGIHYLKKYDVEVSYG